MNKNRNTNLAEYFSRMKRLVGTADTHRFIQKNLLPNNLGRGNHATRRAFAIGIPLQLPQCFPNCWGK